MKLIPLPAFEDIDLWFLHDGRRAPVADPGDAQPVAAALQREGLQLEAILVTRHYPDHVGGGYAPRDASGAKLPGKRRGRCSHPVKNSPPYPGKPGCAAHMNTHWAT